MSNKAIAILEQRVLRELVTVGNSDVLLERGDAIMSQHIGCLCRGETQLTIQSHRIGRNQEHAFVHTVQIQALQTFHTR